MNILITAGSRRVPLVQAFQAALSRERRGRVVVTDVDPSSPAVHVVERAYRVPMATDAGYVDALLDICVAEQIRLVVPTVDDELEVVGQARARFAEVGAIVACSPAETAALCNDKYRNLLASQDAKGRSSSDMAPRDAPGRSAAAAFHQAARLDAAASVRFPSATSVSETSSSATSARLSSRSSCSLPSTPSTCCATGAAGRCPSSRANGRSFDRECPTAAARSEARLSKLSRWLWPPPFPSAVP